MLIETCKKCKKPLHQFKDSCKCFVSLLERRFNIIMKDVKGKEIVTKCYVLLEKDVVDVLKEFQGIIDGLVIKEGNEVLIKYVDFCYAMEKAFGKRFFGEEKLEAE